MMILKNVLQNLLGNLSLSDLVPKSAKPTEDIPPIRPDVDYRTVLLTLSAFSLRLNLAARTAVDASYKRLFDSRLATLARGDRRKSAEWLRVVFLQTTPFNLSTPNRRCTNFQPGPPHGGRPQTPAACHTPNRRQLVLPLQPTSERGRCFHCMPVRRTRMMPASAARSEERGRPPFGFSGSDGRSGSITAQRSSGTRASMPA